MNRGGKTIWDSKSFSMIILYNLWSVKYGVSKSYYGGINMFSSRRLSHFSCESITFSNPSPDSTADIYRIETWGIPARHGGTPKCLVYSGKIPLKLGWWLGVPLWLRTPLHLCTMRLVKPQSQSRVTINSQADSAVTQRLQNWLLCSPKIRLDMKYMSMHEKFQI